LPDDSHYCLPDVKNSNFTKSNMAVDSRFEHRSRDKLPVLAHFRFRFGSRNRRHLQQRIFNDQIKLVMVDILKIKI